jgi:hypothetical protein
VVSRDYINAKVWDIRKNGAHPIHNFKIMELEDNKLQDMYDNDCIFDRFDVKMSHDC